MTEQTESDNEEFCWEKRTKVEKWLIILVAVMGIVLLALAVVLGTSSRNASSEIDDICTDAACVQAASLLLDHIDTEIDPCEDFYQFACGKHIKYTVIPEDKSSIDTYDKVLEKLQSQLRTALEEPIDRDTIRPFVILKQYYQTCMDTDTIEEIGLQQVKELLRELGGWPVLEAFLWDGLSFDWVHSDYKLRNTGLPSDYFIKLTVGIDAKNSTRRVIEIDQPRLGITREFLINGLNDKFVKAYLEFMVDVAEAFKVERHRALKELTDALEFEIMLAHLSPSHEERLNRSSIYNIMSIDDLQYRFPSVPWMQYISNALGSGVHLTRHEPVVVWAPQYITALEALVRRTPKRVQANYAIWRAIHDIIPYLNEDLKSLKQKFSKESYGILEREPQWKKCVKDTTFNLPVLTGALYVRNYFDEESKENASEMVKQIKDQLISNFENVEWMDEETKEHALKKAEGMLENVGYPEELMDDLVLEVFFQKLYIYPDEYLKSTLAIRNFTTYYENSNLHKVVERDFWYDNSAVANVNAFYHPSKNSITIFAGILQEPYFNKEHPKYLNFGGVGSVIGHEITHGFDSEHSDEEGNLANWWTPETEAAFQEKSQCIIDQYANFSIDEIEENLNGLVTQEENIADIGGVKIAYLAYQTWVLENGEEQQLPGLAYTPNQLFWISVAINECSKTTPEKLKQVVLSDEHPPGEYRVLGPLRNLEYFSLDFECPLNSEMNPAEKCSVW